MRPRLRSFELAWTDAAFDAIFPEPSALTVPSAPRLPHGIVKLHPARFFDDLLVDVPLEQSLGLRLAVWMVAFAPIFTFRRLGTIASLPTSERVRLLERLVASPFYVIRQLVISLKSIGTLLYARSPSVRARMVSPHRGPGKLVELRMIRARKSPRMFGGTPHEHAAE
ncbi:hypothetical protein AKJ09_09715 [Labilithrix luteola]|uniref:Uncharacterized protein n=1 Tax=Labilithrix luteola TaxID=1391654 RepID=A0A0K1QBK6_9BACT|nr:hypothetical protein [Labilithrix luteola]AKV03052.1 hypothetical protein AKJ09_09715 [Labilithrix luteola]